jgi:hypothetical protein
MAIVYLDSSARTRQIKVTGWSENWHYHYGRFGAWTMFQLNPLDDSVVVTDEKLYAGDGSDFHWMLKFS